MKKQENFFTDKESFKTIDSNRIIYFVIAIIFFFLTEIGRNIYRPFIYKNSIDDFGIADSIGNSGGIIVQIFLLLAVLNSPKKKVFRVIGFIAIGYIIYEVLQIYLPRGVFDWKDIYGTFIGATIVLFILWVKNLFMKQNKIIHKF